MVQWVNLALQVHRDHLDARRLVVILALVVHQGHLVYPVRRVRRAKKETTEQMAFQAGRVETDNQATRVAMALTVMPVTVDHLVHAAHKVSREKRVQSEKLVSMELMADPEEVVYPV